MATTTGLSELTGDYVLDTAATRIGFVGRHTMSTRVPGEFGKFEGSVYLDGDDPARSRAQLTIQADSIQTGHQGRDDQLRSSFLAAGKYPIIVFTSTKVEQVATTTFQVTGDLTIRGVTRPVTVDLELTRAAADQVCFQGRLTINRMQWGANWNVATRLMVSPKVTLDLAVSAVR